MQYKKVHLIYFSPTHTSAKIAYSIAEGLGATTFSESDITHGMPEAIEKIEDELTILAVPVYGGRVAETAIERLRAFRAAQAPAIAVVVYGNRDYEDALRELCDTASGLGFVPVAAAAFVGEHSFSRPEMPIAAGRPDETDLREAMAFGQAVLAKLDSLSAVETISLPQVKGDFPYKQKSPATPQAPVTREEGCTQCAYCIGICPTGAISVVDGALFSDPATCIKCCACVKECPEGARSFDTPYTAMLHTHFSARRAPELFV